MTTATTVEVGDKTFLSIPAHDRQDNVNAYFDVESSYWNQLYGPESGLLGEIIRDRQRAALDCILDLNLPSTSRVLEIGCGAGYMSIELARRGLSVHAVDASRQMVEKARRNAKDIGVPARVTFEQADVHNLPYANESFDLVVAIGVLPWVALPPVAISEVTRVTKRAGYALFTTANLLELRNLFDPWRYPFLRPLKLGLKQALVRSRLLRQSPSLRMERPSVVDRQLEDAGLTVLRRRAIGFGPFSIFGRPILPEGVGIALHKRLQRLADVQVFPFKETGMSYLVVTRRH